MALLTRALPWQAGWRVLDVGCGAGRHARALASAGAQPIGLDLSAELLACARGVGLPLVRADMRRLPVRSSFDEPRREPLHQLRVLRGRCGTCGRAAWICRRPGARRLVRARLPERRQRAATGSSPKKSSSSASVRSRSPGSFATAIGVSSRRLRSLMAAPSSSGCGSSRWRNSSRCSPPPDSPSRPASVTTSAARLSVARRAPSCSRGCTPDANSPHALRDADHLASSPHRRIRSGAGARPDRGSGAGSTPGPSGRTGRPRGHDRPAAGALHRPALRRAQGALRRRARPHPGRPVAAARSCRCSGWRTTTTTFAEANHAAWLRPDGSLHVETLPDRPPEAALRPMAQEPLGAGSRSRARGARRRPLAVRRPGRGAPVVALRISDPRRRLGTPAVVPSPSCWRPLGVLCLDGSHAALKAKGAPIVRRALEDAAEIESALVARAGALVGGGARLPASRSGTARRS